MTIDRARLLTAAAIGLLAFAPCGGIVAPSHAQEATAEAAATEPPVAEEQAPEPLSAEELEILVARIALYPDELVALVASSSLFPVQIVQADRYLEDYKKNKDLKPKSTWDGSVVSLLNYPEVVHMMAEDLDWTEAMGEAIANQQEDVLTAIQQLRETAVARGVIKTDEKVKVVKEQDNIVIQPASTEVIYVPQYEPEMLYVPNYDYQPVTYYPDPYPYYYNPAATFFAAAVTGAVWGGIVDWNDGFWGGDWDWGDGWHGGDIDIDCNKCFNNVDFNGKLDLTKVDWKNVDRSKINFDKNKFTKIDKSKVKNSIKANDRNRVKNKVGELNRTRPSASPGKGKRPAKDVRVQTLEGLKKPGNKAARPADKAARPNAGAGDKLGRPADRPDGNRMDKAKFDRPVGKPKPAARPDTRPAKPSPLGEVKGGKQTKNQSNRGSKAMGGGIKRPDSSGGGAKAIKKPKHKIGAGGGGGKQKRARRR
jgi:hypothetical protein